MHSRLKRILVMTALCFAGVLVACSDYSRGAKIFQREQCHECHTIHGKNGSTGPNLSTVGKRRSRDFILQQIKNPKANKPDTSMPSFAGRLSEEDIHALADYLAGLK